MLHYVIHYIRIDVTGFELPCTQQQDMLFSITWQLYTITKILGRYISELIVIKAALAVTCFWIHSDVYEWSDDLRWLHLYWKSSEFACTLTHHFIAPHHPTLHPYRSAYSIGVASEKLSKMLGNLASYPFNSLCIDRLCMIMNSYRIMVNCMQESVFLPEIQHSNNSESVFLNIYNCVSRWFFWNPVTYVKLLDQFTS